MRVNLTSNGIYYIVVTVSMSLIPTRRGIWLQRALVAESSKHGAVLEVLVTVLTIA